MIGGPTQIRVLPPHWDRTVLIPADVVPARASPGSYPTSLALRWPRLTSTVTAPEAVGHQRPQLHKSLFSPGRGPRLVHVPDEIHNGWKGQVRPIPENCVACLRKAN